MEKMNKNPKLYVVATPIGNPGDITLRAIEILKNIDFLICEEYKIGSKLLNHLKIKKPLELLNEHNEGEETDVILEKLLLTNETAAIISDAGTPLFADPGNELVRKCHLNGIPVIPIPGVSSIMTALMVSGLSLEKFLFYGFLPANKFERIKAIKKLPSQYDLILLEAPYRLKQLMRDLLKTLSDKREAIIAYKLTYPEEKLFWGTLKELQIMTQNLPKGEFVFILKKISDERNNYKKR